MLRIVLAVAAIIAGCCPTLASDVLTCTQFREALTSAIRSGGGRVAEPDLTSAAYKRPDGTMIRYDLHGVAGMTGSLECHLQDRMHMLSIETKIDADEGAVRVLRLQWLLAASICAIEPSPSSTCDAKADRLASNAVSNFTKARVRGEIDPDGVEKIVLKGDVDVEVDASPGLIMFSVSPPWGK